MMLICVDGLVSRRRITLQSGLSHLQTGNLIRNNARHRLLGLGSNRCKRDHTANVAPSHVQRRPAVIRHTYTHLFGS